MSGLDEFERLAARARAAVPPRVDVADRVVRTIAAQRSDRLPSLVAAGLVATAAAVAVLVAVSGASEPDPTVEIFRSLLLVMR